MTGCGAAGGQESKEEAARAYYDGLQAAQFHVKLLSDLGQSALEYEADYEYSKTDSDRLTLTAPEDLSGISETISGDDRLELTLEYDGTLLDAPGSAVAGFSPADAVPYLLYDLRESSPDEVWQEQINGEEATVLRYVREGTEKQVWLSEKTCAPLCAELYVDGRRVVRCVFSEFQGQ